MARPIKVAMLIQGYYPRVGGAERQLAALVPLLKTHGVEIHILTRRYAGLPPFERVQDVPVHRLPVPSPKPLASLTFTLSALSRLRQLRPHVIHAHELLSPTTAAVTAKRMLGIPVVAKVLRGGILGDIAKLKGKPLGQQRLSMFRKHVNAFIVISQEIDAELAEMGVASQRRRFIPNGVDIERFTPVTPRYKRALRASLGLPDGPIALFTGRLEAEKRVDQLIDIWPTVREAHPTAQLVLAGTGSEEATLKQAAGTGIQFLGRVEDVARYLQAGDLFILPSATEGLSNALLEALASGLPVIATDVGGASDVIEHGNTGWLVPPDTPATLKEAILTLFGDNACRQNLGQQGRTQVIHNYALSTTASRLHELYRQLIEMNQ